MHQASSQTTPIGGGQNFREAIFTGKCTQLTIAITGGVTVLRVGVQNNAMSKASRKIILWFTTPLVTFWGTVVANEVKLLSNKFVGTRRQLGCKLPSAPRILDLLTLILSSSYL